MKKFETITDIFLSVGLFSFSLAASLPVEDFIIDLISHFRLHYFLAGLILSAVFLFRKKRIFALICFLSLIPNGHELYPYFVSAPKVSSESKPVTELKLLLSNIHALNETPEECIAQISAINADVSVLLEVTESWKDFLKPLEEQYPYRQIYEGRSWFGVSIFSKFPFSKLELSQTEQTKESLLGLKVLTGDETIAIFGAHPLPPTSYLWYRIRNLQLSETALNILQTQEPVILLGDLNTSPYSASFKNFLKTSDLTNPRHYFGFLPTWPLDSLPQLNFLGVPIDHILTSRQLHVKELRSVQIPGSDHAGLVGTIDY